MRGWIKSIVGAVVLASSPVPVLAQGRPDSPPPGKISEFRYYRLGNTGVQGDSSEALWVGPDGDPWIGGYDPIFEEGGIAKLVQAEQRFVNLSNVDFTILGHPNDTGTVRVQDIVADPRGVLWFPSWTAVFSYDPAVGPRKPRLNSGLLCERSCEPFVGLLESWVTYPPSCGEVKY